MAYNTVKIKSYLNIINNPVAISGITPGHLIQLDSAGKVEVHGLAKGFNGANFAMEDELQGETIDTAYVATDIVQMLTATPGDEINAILKDGETAVIGTSLESAGDGTLQAFTDGIVIAVALEAVDMSGSSGVDPSPRILVRIV